MIRIAICDDDMNVIESIRRYLEEKDKQLQGEQLSVSTYSSGEDFLRDIESGTSFHIVFMDIQMDGMNGVEVGHRLRARPDGDDTIMIYVSSYDSYQGELLDVGGIHFTKKPINEAKLDRIFGRALNQAIKYKGVANRPRQFWYKINTEAFSARIDEIAYMKNDKKMVELYMMDQTEKVICFRDRFYSSIADVMEQLPEERFVQCERSYVVNLDYICRMRNDSLILVDNDQVQIPIGRAYREHTKAQYFKRRRDQYV